MKKLLYLADQDSTVSPDRASLLLEYADQAFTPDIKYDKGDVLEDMVRLAENAGISCVIGAGVGAHVAEHISDRLGIPAMLISPEFDAPEQKVHVRTKCNKQKLVVVGQLDDPGSKVRAYRHARKLGYEVLLLSNIHAFLPVSRLREALDKLVELYLGPKYEGGKLVSY